MTSYNENPMTANKKVAKPAIFFLLTLMLLTFGSSLVFPSALAQNRATYIEAEDESQVKRTGFWDLKTGSTLHGEKSLEAPHPGVWLLLNFTGTSLKIGYQTGPNAGMFGVILNSQTITPVDSYSSTPGQKEYVAATNLPPGKHLVVITVVTGPINIDYFLVEGATAALLPTNSGLSALTEPGSIFTPLLLHR